jgi:UDP-N-acetylglucosamine 4-epimerase
VLHHAGFVSVPLSNEDPVGCHHANVNGTLNLLVAARDNRVRRFVHASSSAVYGGDSQVPMAETATGRAISAYGASKQISEIYVRLFFDLYGLETVSLRYFNVFGRRQNPIGGYAAVIPQWIDKSLRGQECVINGSGEITRDFSPVANIVQANILAATTRSRKAIGEALNVAAGSSTALSDLYQLVSRAITAKTGTAVAPATVGPSREGEIQHSMADIQAIREALGFCPDVDLPNALAETVRWYASRTKQR